MSTVILTVFIIGILIIIHEVGHFLLAKLNGVKVLEFSIGFGPYIVKKQIGDTVYSLRIIPFGGYVRMSGEDPGKDHYEKHDFLAQPFYKKITIVLGGPIFNLIFAILVFIVAYSAVGYPVIPITKIERVEEGSRAYFAGIMPGDSIVKIDDIKVKSWDDFYVEYARRDTNVVKIYRNGQILSLVLTGKSSDSLGVVPYIPPLIYKVEKGGAAWESGLKSGDLVLEVEDESVNSWKKFVDLIRSHPGESLSITLLRGKDTIRTIIVPRLVELPDGSKIGRIGVLLPMAYKRLPPLMSLKVSLVKSYDTTVLLLKYLVRLVRGKSSVKNLGGPIMIGKMVQSSREYGLFNLLFLIGLISVNLFVINIIPFPALDGWHVLIFSVEAVRRKPLSSSIQTWLQLVGFAFLIILMLLITFFDILRIIK